MEADRRSLSGRAPSGYDQTEPENLFLSEGGCRCPAALGGAVKSGDKFAGRAVHIAMVFGHVYAGMAATPTQRGRALVELTAMPSQRTPSNLAVLGSIRSSASAAALRSSRLFSSMKFHG